MKKRPCHRYFPVNFTKFSGTPFTLECLLWLLLYIFSLRTITIPSHQRLLYPKLYLFVEVSLKLPNWVFSLGWLLIFNPSIMNKNWFRFFLTSLSSNCSCKAFTVSNWYCMKSCRFVFLIFFGYNREKHCMKVVWSSIIILINIKRGTIWPSIFVFIAKFLNSSADGHSGTYLGPCQTSMIELLIKVVNCFIM